MRIPAAITSSLSTIGDGLYNAGAMVGNSAQAAGAGLWSGASKVALLVANLFNQLAQALSNGFGAISNLVTANPTQTLAVTAIALAAGLAIYGYKHCLSHRETHAHTAKA